jgi:hypothetical protein
METEMIDDYEKVMDKKAKTLGQLIKDNNCMHGIYRFCKDCLGECEFKDEPSYRGQFVKVNVAVAEHNKDILTLTRTFTKMLERKEKERDEQKNKLLLPLKEILEELRKNLQLDVTPGWGYYDDKIGTILKLIDEKLTVEC